MIDYTHPLLLPKSKYNWSYHHILRPMILVVYFPLLLCRALLVLPLLGTSSLIDFLLNCGTDPAEPPAHWRRVLFRLNKRILYRLALLSLGWVVI